MFLLTVTRGQFHKEFNAQNKAHFSLLVRTQNASTNHYETGLSPPDPRTRTFLGLTNGSVICTNFLLIPAMDSLMHCLADGLSTFPWLRTICIEKRAFVKLFYSGLCVATHPF
jgi:hypothetical protein